MAKPCCNNPGCHLPLQDRLRMVGVNNLSSGVTNPRCRDTTPLPGTVRVAASQKNSSTRGDQSRALPASLTRRRVCRGRRTCPSPAQLAPCGLCLWPPQPAAQGADSWQQVMRAAHPDQHTEIVTFFMSPTPVTSLVATVDRSETEASQVHM